MKNKFMREVRQPDFNNLPKRKCHKAADIIYLSNSFNNE